MPQIQEYLPQQAAQEPVGGTSPNIELAGAVGRGIENVGSAISEGGELLHRRSVQEEQSNLYADFADKRAEQTQKLQSQVQDGSLDIEKFQDEYDQSTQGTYDKISTPEGRNYFERQNARLRGQLLRSASVGQAQIAARNAGADLMRARDSTSNAIRSDPTQFDDALGAGIEDIDQRIKTGGLPEKMRGQAVNEMGRDYAKSAIRGLADIDPDHAKGVLDKGTFDQYLSGDQKNEMYSFVESRGRARDAEDARADRADAMAKKLAGEAFGAANFSKMANGTLPMKSITDAVDHGQITWEQGERFQALNTRAIKDKTTKSDPRLFLSLQNQIMSGQISDSSQMDKNVGNGLVMNDYDKLNRLFDKQHPEIKAGEKSLFQTIHGLRFKNNMTGQSDLIGDDKAMQASQDYYEAKKTISQKGGTVHDLLDPKSKFFFASPENMAKYQTSWQDQLQGQFTDRSDKSLKIQRPDHADQPSNVKPVNENVRLKDESPMDNLIRSGFFKTLKKPKGN